MSTWKLSNLNIEKYASRKSNRPRGLRFSTGRPLVGQLALLLYLACNLAILLSYYYQHQYDYYLFHQKQLLARQNETSLGPRVDKRLLYGPDLERARRILAERVESSRLSLEKVGAPLLKGSYAGQYFVLVWIASCFVTCPTIVLFHKYLDRVDSFFVDAMLDLRRAQSKMNALIVEEVNTFIGSHQNFTICQVERTIHLPTWRGNKSGIRRLLSVYKSSCLSLRSMVLDGRLGLMNRSPSRILEISSFYLKLAIFIQLNLWTFCIGAPLLAIWFGLLGTRPMDVMIVVAITFIVLFTVFCGSNIFLLLLANWLDQRELMSKIEQLIRWSIIELQSDGGNRKRAPSKSDQGLGLLQDPSNERLLEVLLNYKLFARQMSRVHILFDYTALVSLAVLFIPSLVGQLHAPYVSREVRYVMILWSLYSLWFTMPSLLIVCQSKKRCIGIYKLLSQLVAHLISSATDDEPTDKWDSPIDQHTLWALHQELDDPELVLKRLAPSSLGSCFTYQTLVRSLFWFSLLILSLALDLSRSSKLYSDPLRVFQVNFL